MEVNPGVIFQSAVALIAAMSITDATKDLAKSIHPDSIAMSSMYRIGLLIILVLITMWIVNDYEQKKYHKAKKYASKIKKEESALSDSVAPTQSVAQQAAPTQPTQHEDMEVGQHTYANMSSDIYDIGENSLYDLGAY
jgi:hypothetical protein